MIAFEQTARETINKTKRRVTAYQDEFLEQLNAMEVDAHWFRRVFHTAAASFLLYYLLPDIPWVNTGKIVLSIVLVALMILIEYRRIHGDLDHKRFFGLRAYEKHRPASYLYFGIATLILFLFFPQQIAIPCILCASFTDPIIGESRYYLGKKHAYLIGFLISLFLFLVVWHQTAWWTLIPVCLLGATGAVLGEAKKLRFIDDDFMIQILPAVLLAVLWQGCLAAGIHILPPPTLYPL